MDRVTKSKGAEKLTRLERIERALRRIEARVEEIAARGKNEKDETA